MIITLLRKNKITIITVNLKKNIKFYNFLFNGTHLFLFLKNYDDFVMY